MRLFGEGFRDQHCSLATVSSYIDGALRSGEMQRVESHLASCAYCTVRVEELQSVVGVLRAMPTVPAPRSFAVPVPAPAAPVYVREPARRWWQPAPVAGFRAVAAAAALAFAVVFAGDMSGVIGTPEAPVQTGLNQPGEFITTGNPPGPEQPLRLGENPLQAPANNPVVDTPVEDGTAAAAATALPKGSWLGLELWPLEVALLGLTAVLAAISILVRRRSTSA